MAHAFGGWFPFRSVKRGRRILFATHSPPPASRPAGTPILPDPVKRVASLSPSFSPLNARRKYHVAMTYSGDRPRGTELNQAPKMDATLPEAATAQRMAAEADSGAAKR